MFLHLLKNKLIIRLLHQNMQAELTGRKVILTLCSSWLKIKNFLMIYSKEEMSSSKVSKSMVDVLGSMILVLSDVLSKPTSNNSGENILSYKKKCLKSTQPV